MEIKNLDVDELIPYEKNPRKNDDAVQYVAESIKQFGFKVPIVIDRNNVIVTGHTRLKAAKELGLKQVPCIVADDLTDEQIKAFRLADNKVSEKAEWDFELLDEELSEILDINMEDLGFAINFDLQIETSKDLKAENIDEIDDADETDDADDVPEDLVYEKDEIINEAFQYYRKKGFPFPNLTLFECMQEINKLASLDMEKLKTSKVAYKVADTFHTHRFEGSALNMKSPMKAFENDKDLKKALSFEYPKIKSNAIHFITMVNGTQQCSNFRPAFALYILKKYGIDNDIYLDPCSGYGGRLVGFLASNYKMYIGTDPSKKSYEANLEIKEKLGSKKEILQYDECFEDLDLSAFKDKIDIVFTSPPYFNKEVYDGENKKQSMNKFVEYENWKEGFLKQLISKSFYALKKGHYFILNIEDILQKGIRYNLVEDSIELAQKIGFKYEGIEKFDLPDRTRIENDEKVKVEAYESVIIFKK